MSVVQHGHSAAAADHVGYVARVSGRRCFAGRCSSGGFPIASECTDSLGGAPWESWDISPSVAADGRRFLLLAICRNGGSSAGRTVAEVLVGMRQWEVSDNGRITYFPSLLLVRGHIVGVEGSIFDAHNGDGARGAIR